ncbi:MAG: hypothetical protein IKH34_03955 [Oscillospiraceae bacterium]|nr:hypothetical protein [Oscillospiraceae bacterium]
MSMEKTYAVWISNADDLHELMELGNDLLMYTGLTWDESIRLFEMSLAQGFTCIMVKEESEA